MKLGITYPSTELNGSPEAAKLIIHSVEEAGFDHIVVYDHPVAADHAHREPKLTGPYNLDHAFHDPFTFLTYAAALTERVELITGVLILPERQTVIVAKQSTDLELFSAGRFVLGVGSGWNWVEYDALGRDFSRRGHYLDEQIPLLRRLWTEEVVSHRGELESFERAGLVVRPRSTIPIWLGGAKEPAFRRAGRIGDGFHFGLRPHLTLAEQWDRVRHHLRENGRSEATFSRNLIIEKLDGNPRSAAEELLRWRDCGHSHGTIQSTGLGLEGAAAHLDYFYEVAAIVRAA